MAISQAKSDNGLLKKNCSKGQELNYPTTKETATMVTVQATALKPMIQMTLSMVVEICSPSSAILHQRVVLAVILVTWVFLRVHHTVRLHSHLGACTVEIYRALATHLPVR